MALSLESKTGSIEPLWNMAMQTHLKFSREIQMSQCNFCQWVPYTNFSYNWKQKIITAKRSRVLHKHDIVVTQSETQGEARLGPWSLLLCDTQKSYFCFEYREFCLEWRKRYKNEQCIMHTWWMLLERDETQTNSIALSVADVRKRPKCIWWCMEQWVKDFRSLCFHRRSQPKTRAWGIRESIEGLRNR